MSITKKESLTPKVGFATAADISRKYLEQGYNVLLTGAPGIGKTALMRMVAKDLGYDLVIFHPVISDPTDFKGLPWCFTDKDGNQQAVFIAFDQLKLLTEAKRPLLCGLDDFGQSPEAVQASCMQLLHGGELAGKKISKHVRFMACTNRKQDRAGVAGILEPVKSRFHGIFELIPELEPFLAYSATVGISPMLMAFMRHRPNWLTGGDTGWSAISDIANQPCPRTIEHLSDVVNLDLDRIVRPSAYAGAVGQAMANEYFAFESLATRMPDMEVICKNPLGAEVPNSPEICYAMIGALHSRMNRGNLGNIYKYLDRAFSKELQAVFHLDVEKFNPGLVKHEAFIKFSIDNGDLFTN